MPLSREELEKLSKGDRERGKALLENYEIVLLVETEGWDTPEITEKLQVATAAVLRRLHILRKAGHLQRFNDGKKYYWIATEDGILWARRMKKEADEKEPAVEEEQPEPEF